jgi:hypothetical protein
VNVVEMVASEARKPLFIGTHLGWYEAPDLLWLEFHGDVSGAQVLEYVALRERLLQGQKRILTLLDVRDLREPSAETRRTVARLKDPRPQASAIIGASYRTKVMTELGVKAVYLFTGKRIEVDFFATPEAGYAWLLEMRPRI